MSEDFLDCEYQLISEEKAVFTFDGEPYPGKPIFPTSWLFGYHLMTDAYGRILFQSLFPPTSKLNEGYRIALRTARKNHKPLRFRLRIDADDDSVLHHQNWERMIDPDEDLYLGKSSEVVFSRFLSPPGPSSYQEAASPKVLVVISCPQNQTSQGLPEISAEKSEKLIHETFGPLVTERVLSYEILQAPATRSRVRDKLISGNFQILHIQAHGVLSRGAIDSSLVLELENREADYVNQSELAGISGGIPGLNLVTLVTCYSGAQAGNSPFKSLAGQLVKDGIPAVVAMQQSISVEASRHFVEHFYRNLARNGYVDKAINEARNQVALLPSAKNEWSNPVLYMRLNDGKIFQRHPSQQIPKESEHKFTVNNIEVKQVDNPMETNQKIVRLLHLSDFHFTADTKDGGLPVKALNQSAVNRSLLEKIEKLVKDGQTYDLIVITGDIAFSGKPEEYAVATDFCQSLLTATRLSTDRLFVVPGNHDVIRGEVKKTHLKWYAFSKPDEVSEILTDTDHFSMLMRKFANYREFANSVMNRKLYDETRYFYVEKVALQKSGETLGVNILGLNSALFCGYDGDDDRKLVFGRPQIDAALRECDKNAALSIALFHHPFHGSRMPCYHHINEDDETQLTRAIDLILTGHLHTPKNSFVQNSAGSTIHVQAGASFESRESQNAFDVIELDLATGEGHVQFYKYVSAHQTWLINNEVNPHDKKEEGRFRFEIKRLTKKPVVTPTPEPIPPAPKVEASKAEVPAIPGDEKDEGQELLGLLKKLDSKEFNEMIRSLGLNREYLPSKKESDQNVDELIRLAKGPEGCGLKKIKEYLEQKSAKQKR